MIVYLNDIAANEHGILLTDEISEIDESRARPGRTGQSQDLRLVVLHVLLDVDQLLDAGQSILQIHRLRRGTPVDI